MGDLAIGLGTTLAAGYITSRAQKKAEESLEKGTQQQAEQEAISRGIQQQQFEGQIARQQPFLEAGQLALPQLVESISGRGDVSGLPATQAQRGMITDFLGEQAPEFVTEDALANLEAVEAERNKSRLSDLVNIGLGGVGASAGSGVNLGTTLGRSLATESNIRGQGLQQAASSRENRRNQLIQGLTGLPALGGTAFQNRPQQAVSPFITPQNPLGLTPGQGL